ncbi:MAG TPA: sodium:proton antiporter, partial [Thermoanaerobaculia bacterium]|nr:sodium:proton antiporter [Thermoanaerobaculia bacterium]
MTAILDVAALLLTAVAVLGFLNHRFAKLPPAIAMLTAGLLAGVAIVISDRLWPALAIAEHLAPLSGGVDFSTLLMKGMLGFLLFAGSLTVDYQELRQHLRTVLVLATLGVLLSTFLVGAGAYFLFALVGIPVPFVYCLLFGALISPTDPVAVLALMEHLRVPRSFLVIFTGESLVNDGVGVVVFTVLLAVATAPGSVSPTSVSLLLAREALGGSLLGLAGGLVMYYAARRVDEPNLEVQISVALVTALIALAAHLHVSGPLACVMAGIFVGNRARRHAMRDATAEALDRIWSFADYVMNAVLFLLLGLQAATFHIGSPVHAAMVLGMIVLVLAARFVSVALPLPLVRGGGDTPQGTAPLLTWGGLRGGISVALALSLPPFAGRDAVLNATYAVVVFAILV